MRIVSRYVRDSYLVTFVMTLTVLTFVMCVMVLFRIADAIATGGSLYLIGKIFLSGLPSAIGLSIPFSIITAALLTFGKLSANGEITAMKSSGIRMLQIMRQPILFALLMSAVCLYLNAEVIPDSFQVRRNALRQLGLESPLQLIEEGRPIRNFPGMTFYIGSKRDNHLEDIIIYQSGQKSSPPREIRARSGTVSPSEDKKSILIDLYDVRIDPFYEDRPGAGTASHFPYSIDLTRLMGPETAKKLKRSDMSMSELLEARHHLKENFPELKDDALAVQDMALRVEFNKRIVMAVSCFVFVLLGAPLATKTHRQETTIGIGISLGLIFAFYLFVIAAETLVKYPLTQPHLILWMPVMLATGLGLFLIKRCD